MKNFSTAFIILFLFSLNYAFAQNSSAVTGYWLTGEKESQVKIYRSDDGAFHGKIVWLEEPYEDDGSIKRDDENPNKELRNRKIMGLKILKNFEYDTGDERWEDGKIYDPKSGKTYDCYMWFENGNTDVLYVKGYIGISLIGRETKWTREAAKR